MHRIASALTVVAFLVLFPALAQAQASITGTVRDTSGGVLPGVTVEVASPALIEKVREAVSDGSGQYRIQNLRPGTYSVTFTLPGFNIVKRDGIELAGTFTAQVNAELRVGGLEETITVVGDAPTVDLQSVTQQRVMDREIIDSIPTGGSERNLAVLIPGVTLSAGQDVGGAMTNVQGSMTVHGSRGNDQRITQNGVPISISFGGGQNSGVLTNTRAYEEVTVDTGGASAELPTGGVRINLIPREGGNEFAGTFFTSFANESMQDDNFSEDLQALGLRRPNKIRRNFDINPGFGGPIKRDTLWFYTSVRYFQVSNYPAAIFNNLNANNPNLWTYVPDPSSRPFNESTFKDFTVRLTWQATSKHKLATTFNPSTTCYCLQDISATTSPEAALRRYYPRSNNIHLDWTAPLTNQVLIDASMIKRVELPFRRLPPDTGPQMISVTDQALGNLVYRAPAGVHRDTLYNTLIGRISTSYITGAHALKVGFNMGRLSERTDNFPPTQPYSFRFNNGVPNQITLRATPWSVAFKADADLGAFVQDKWTVGRLTLSYGLRYDYFKSHFPEGRAVPGPLVPNRNIAFPRTPGLAWHDLSPKSGVSYDLFGDGRTALKMSVNKYLQGLGSGGVFGTGASPVGRLVNTTTRSWNDRNRDFTPDCDLTNPAANGECGAMANRAFGGTRAGATLDPDTLEGWGKREYNWEVSAGIQREILPRVALDFGYFRRWYGNFIVTDDLALAPSDYDPFSITAPADPELPGGGGYVIEGLYNLNPSAFGRSANQLVTFSDNYGKQTEHFNGVDLTMSARPGNGLVFQGGVSTGQTSTNNCEVVAKLDNPSPLYCDRKSGFLTQVKFLTSYTIPRVDVLVSGAYQSAPGPALAANFAVPSAVAARTLGRPLSGSAANVTVNIVEPGTVFGERLHQLDLRFSKVLRFAGTRTALNVDLYNALNANTVLTLNNSYGGRTPWLAPQSILLARFVKLGVQVDF